MATMSPRRSTPVQPGEFTMSRLTIPTRESAPADSQASLTAVDKQLGVVPNLFRLIGQSPAALQGFLGLSGALNAALDARTRERIALAIAQQNGCDYCLSAHTYLGLNLAKLPQEEIDRNRTGRSNDDKADAAVRFAVKVVQTRGVVSDGDLRDFKSAGYTDGQVVEIVGLVAVNVFTNYLNNIALTEIDFPVVRVSGTH
jgi:uncharacterized peroxidase-related enzyme